MSKETLKEAVKKAGGQAELARRIRSRLPSSKITQTHISGWLRGRVKGEVPPSKYVIAIAESVDWEVTPHELRRDIYPNPADAMPTAAAAA